MFGASIIQVPRFISGKLIFMGARISRPAVHFPVPFISGSLSFFTMPLLFRHAVSIHAFARHPKRRIILG